MNLRKNTRKIAIGVIASTLAMTLAGAASAQSALDKKFAKTAAQGGIAEVQSSQLALQKSHNPQVLNIARMMVKQHTAVNNELKTVAQNKNMMLPTDTDPKHKAAYRKLSRLSGTTFDKAYMAGQEKDHAATVKLFQKEIALGLDKDITGFATKNLPTIEDHTKMIFQVGSNLGVHSTLMPTLKAPMMPSSMSGHNM